MLFAWASVPLAFAFGAAVDAGVALSWGRARVSGERERVRTVFAWQGPVMLAMLCGAAWLIYFLLSGARGPVAGAHASWVAAFLAGYVCGGPARLGARWDARRKRTAPVTSVVPCPIVGRVCALAGKGVSVL